jgi:hypothetical protein
MSAASFKFEPVVRGDHAHVTVRCGQPGQRAHCGTLTLLVDEWRLLRSILSPDVQHTPLYEPFEIEPL